MKRPWPQEQDFVFGESVQERDALESRLEAVYTRLGPSDTRLAIDANFIWDTSSVLHLVPPTRDAAATSYSYVGRALGEKLYARILAQVPLRPMQVLGAKGSGKSRVVSTIAGYLIASRQRRVVYILGKRFVLNPHAVLVDALLLAFGRGGRDGELAKLENLESLVLWCRAQKRGSLLFVVDEWDIFEKTGSPLRDALQEATMFQVLVTVSSVNSRQRQLWEDSDKADEEMETFHFDGPYNSSELATWIAQSSLDGVSQLQDLERLTGGMPLLLRFYEDVKGNEKDFAGRIQAAYTHKLYSKFIGNLVNRRELSAGMALVVSGERGHLLTQDKVDMTCFYYDEKEQQFHILSSFLRSQAESYIMEQHESLQSSLQLSDIQRWAAAVRLDCEQDQGPRNSARVGWNVEGLVIAVVRFQKRLFGLDFKHYRVYRHGCERNVVSELTMEELVEGVLLGPAAFNERAVDLILLKLERNGTLKIIAVQITVAGWKTKSKKRTHEAWKTEVLPKWIVKGNQAIQDDYFDVMPESVASDGDPASLRRFADVDKCLQEFDLLLELADPNERAKQELKRCKGLTASNQPCKNQARCDTADYYCKSHQSQKS
ncbi:hypothetical protein SELMODRAFT_402553 [Selaginella moellendorffii]|uniref:Uncharacterized protein n=1 Tax=Selaginella moellendorffii TaxID=88036 RepID=D8QR17_SELML|nr:hypothetical protein SELMODRAFT_402553 [Selaginella moellendorffii]